MDNLTYEVLTKEFLATVVVHYERERSKTAMEGSIFKLGKKEYAISIFALCDVYNFEKTLLETFPPFKELDAFWDTTGVGA